jgi:hypothetical protein
VSAGFSTSAEWQEWQADQTERQADAAEQTARTVEKMARTVHAIWFLMFAWTTIALIGAVALLLYASN